MMRTIILAVILVLMVVGIAFFAASETAYLATTRLHLKSLLRCRGRQERKALTALYLLDNIDSLLSLVLIGTNFLDTASASIATAIAVSISTRNNAASLAACIATATIAMTAIITVFGEIVPKTYAVSHSDTVVLLAAPLLAALRRVLSPLVALFCLFSRAADAMVRAVWPHTEGGITEDDIKMMIDVGTDEGTLESSERDLLYKIFTLSSITAHDIMRHRSLVKCVSPDASRDDVRTLFTAYSSNKSVPPSYLPVMDGGEVVGVLHYTEVLLGNDGGSCPAPLATDHTATSAGFARRHMRAPLFVPETHTACQVLDRLKGECTDCAIVLDEQGSFAGVVTMDCIVSVVFARLSASSQLSSSEHIRVISGKECILDGGMRLDDVNDLLGTRLASEDFNTLGGWLLEQFGSLPSVGEVFVSEPFVFIVEDQARRRILSVRIKRR